MILLTLKDNSWLTKNKVQNKKWYSGRIIINNTALNYIEYTLEYCIVSPKVVSRPLEDHSKALEDPEKYKKTINNPITISKQITLV